MTASLLARKLGMTRVICPETGKMIPVTVLQVPGCQVLQQKTVEKDGYAATVLASFDRKRAGKNVNQNYKMIREVPALEGQDKGSNVNLESFSDVKAVKVTGVSKGKGFAGVIKRHNFHRGPETHGSHHHREPGSVGMCAKPARILKGKKLPGRMGGAQTTLRSVPVIQIDQGKGLVALKGAIPGPTNGYILLTQTQ